jgi:hypothetical protein
MVAVIFAVPLLRVEASPDALTVAMLGLEDVHVAVVVRFLVLASL